MPRLTVEQLTAIIKGEKPDAVVARRPRRARRARAEAGTPDLAKLRRKFLGDTDAGAAPPPEVDADDDLVDVTVGTETDPDAPKTNVVSESLGRVIGEQG